jgi:hypothetical protein
MTSVQINSEKRQIIMSVIRLISLLFVFDSIFMAKTPSSLSTVTTSTVLKQVNATQKTTATVVKQVNATQTTSTSTQTTATTNTTSTICPTPSLVAIKQDVMITAFDKSLVDLTAAYRSYLCELKTRLASVASTATTSARMLATLKDDPTVVILKSELQYYPIYFYQSIIYKKNGIFYFQEINTGMTLAIGRMLQTATKRFKVSDFPKREKNYQNLIDTLSEKSLYRGMISANFTKIAQAAGGLTGTFETNTQQITASNIGDLMAACTSLSCTPLTP